MNKYIKFLYFLIVVWLVCYIGSNIFSLWINQNEAIQTTSITKVTTMNSVTTAPNNESDQPATQGTLKTFSNVFFRFEIPSRWEAKQMDENTVLLIAPENVNNFLANIKIDIVDGPLDEDFNAEDFCIDNKIKDIEPVLHSEGKIKVDGKDCIVFEYSISFGDYFEHRVTVVVETEDKTIFITLSQDKELTCSTIFSRMLSGFELLN